ncbi:MAG TPA: hypothetical protein PKC28_03830 [Bdellovibrionales bacterium]|nr:hypothetical protein [Bdellovibrionales bacterium]
MKFQCHETVTGDLVQYKFEGYIDESAVFPKSRPAAKVEIDLGGVKGINSVGTRTWCEWLGKIRPPAAVTLDKCPVIFVKNMGNVLGMVTPNTKVQSFYVPFVNKTGKRKDVLVTRDQVSPEGEVLVKGINDEQGGPMQPDVFKAYFGFLRR